MASHNIQGEAGEVLAEEFLRKLNYVILERNWRFRKDELDIIARKDERLIVVEVKTRGKDPLDDPLKAITRAKQRRMIKATNAYILEKNIQEEVRFDIILVTMDQGVPAISHFPDAFYALV